MAIRMTQSMDALKMSHSSLKANSIEFSILKDQDI